MKKNLITVLAIVLIATLSNFAVAQDVLNHFPEGNDVVVNIDLQKAFKLMSEEDRAEMVKESVAKLGYDVSNKMHSIMFSMNMKDMDSDSPAFTAILKADMSMDDLLNAANEGDKKLVSESIAGLQAYRPEDETEDMYFAQAADGLFVIGSKKSLEDYIAVKSGTMANASSNVELLAIVQEMDTDATISMAGVLPTELREQMGQGMPMFGDISNFVFNLSDVPEGIAYKTIVGATDENSLTLMKGMIDQTLPMLKNNDETGLVTEILSNFNSEVASGRLILQGLLTQATIEKITSQFSPMMGKDADADHGHDEYEDQ